MQHIEVQCFGGSAAAIFRVEEAKKNRKKHTASEVIADDKTLNSHCLENLKSSRFFIL
jgi:hypothetical protein